VSLLRCLLLLLVVASASAAPARAAAGDPRELAAGHYARGIELATQGLYEAALEQFNQAYATSPHFAVLYNIGQAQIALGRPLVAIEALSKYLRDGADKIPPSRREQVQAQIALLEAQLGDTPPAATAAPAVPPPAVTAAPAVPPPVTPSGAAATTLALPPVTDARPDSPASRFITLRRAAYASAGLGVAAAGAALGVYLWNRGRYHDWQTGEAALQNLTPGSAAYRMQAVSNNDLATSLTTANHTILGLSIASGLLVATGASLWLVDRGRKRPTGGLALSWTGSSAQLGWSGRW